MQAKDSLLWRLNKLSNIAKHRAIPAHSTRRKLNLEAPPGVRAELAGGNVLVIRGPAQQLRDLKHVPVSTVDVLFGEWPDGIQVTTEDLAAMYDYVVHDVVPKFSRLFPVSEPS